MYIFIKLLLRVDEHKLLLKQYLDATIYSSELPTYTYIRPKRDVCVFVFRYVNATARERPCVL